MSAAETPQTMIPADHLPSLLGASLDACLILRHANDQLSIVGGNEMWSDMCGTPMRDLIRRTPMTCMSADLVAAIERAIVDGLPGHIVTIDDGETHLVGTNGARISLLAIAPANDQDFVMVTARPTEVEAPPAPEATILAALGDGVLTIDRELKIETVNPAVQRMLGFAADHLIGTDVRALATDDSMAALTGHLAATSATPSSVRLTLHASSERQLVVQAITTLIRNPAPAVVMALHDLADQREHEEALAGLSSVDVLTGLANRDALAEHLRATAAEADGTEVTLAFLDLDNFKTVNDALGHDQGDLVLQTIAKRLDAGLGAQGVVARFGGDEFVVASTMPSGTGPDELVHLLAAALADPVELSGKQFQITVSVGVVTTDDPDAMAPDPLLKAADIAMYEAKRRGKDCVVVYEESLEHQATARIEIETDLRRALDNDEFVLHYQPIMDVISGRPVGCEALVRWLHPERGMVRPDEFIPIAEQTGLIVPLGAWVLEKAIEQASEWNRHRLTRRALGISVNLSGLQLGDPDLERRIQAALSRHGFDPARLTLEVTESMLMDDTAETLALLERIRELGIRIAIDDFGTGYSSLAYLKRLPAQALKVDKAFVDGLGVSNEDTSLVTGIIGLASALGFEIVAEGVENELQLKELRRLGCEYSQGYFHSKPLPADEFERWLNGGDDEPDKAPAPDAEPVAEAAADEPHAPTDEPESSDQAAAVSPLPVGVGADSPLLFDQDADSSAVGS